MGQPCRDGKEALTKAKTKRYDFIFMDIGLPDLNGYRVTQRFRKFEAPLARYTPIVALTAHIEEENKEKCIKSGMDAVISKPISKETAEDMLSAFIPKRSEIRNKEDKNIVHKSEETLPLTKISGKPIEVPAEKYGGDRGIVKEILKVFVEILPKEIEALTKAYKNDHWEKVRDLSHKLRGSAIYACTPRLKTACANLEGYLEAGHKKLRKNLYQQVLDEIEAVKEAYKEINKM